MADTLISTANVYVRDNATDTAALRASAAKAISRMTSDIDTFLPNGRVDIIFRANSQMQLIPGTTKHAWGYTSPTARECRINASLTDEQTQYTVLHELAHVVDP